MPIPPVPEGFTFPPACSTREMLSPAVSTSIVTSDGRLPKKPVSVLMGLQLIRGGLCSRNSASRSLKYSDSTSRRRICARAYSITSETKPSLNFPTFTSFARPPISNLGCFHLSGRSFCIFGLATAGDEVAFAGRRHWLPCAAGRASRGGSTARRLAPEGYLRTYETMASAGLHGRGFRCGVPLGEIRLVCAA